MQSAVVALLLLGNAAALPPIPNAQNGTTIHTYIDSNQVSSRDIPNLHPDLTLQARDWSRDRDGNEECNYEYEAKGSYPYGCDRDGLLCYFHQPKWNNSVSDFCSGFITPTTTTTAPTSKYTSSTSTSIQTTPPSIAGLPLAKRAVPAPPWTEWYDRESMSSACSCLLTAPYVATTTPTVTFLHVIPGPTVICQVRGNSKALPGQNEQFHNARSWAKCKMYCEDRPKCLAFGWDEKGKKCFTSLQDVRTLLADNANTPWMWYDMGCPYEYNY